MPPSPAGLHATNAKRVRELADAARAAVYRRTDRQFVRLFAVQGAVAVGIAAWAAAFSPTSHPARPHAWAAVLVAYAVIAPLIGLLGARPGRAYTRHAAAVGQMIVAAVIVHLSGGRVEPHVYVFGSLAFLALYGDWRVLVTAAAVAAADHLVVSTLWPDWVYGEGADPRWQQHVAWVAFIGLFLMYVCVRDDEDIVKAAEREAAVREAEDRLRALGDNLPNGAVFQMVQVGQAPPRMVYISAGIEPMTGLRPAEIVADFGKLVGTIHPDDRPKFDAAAKETLACGAVMNIEVRYRSKDGSYRWKHISSAPRPVDSNVLLIDGVVIDVTEQVVAEEAVRRAKEELEERVEARTAELRATEARFRDLADSMPQIVWTTAPDRAVTYLNMRWHEYTGLADVSREERVKAIHPDDLAAVEGVWKHAMATGTEFQCELRIRRRDGVFRWFLLRAVPVRSADGRLVQWYGTNTDIDDQKRAAEALRASEGRFRVLTEGMPQLVWSTTPVGACEYLSRQWVEYTGIPAEDQIPYGWLDRVHPDDSDRTMNCWSAAINGSHEFDVEYRLRRADGAYRWFKVRGRPMRDEAGAVVRWLGTCTDIDDQKHATAALAAREQDFRAMFESVAVGIAQIDPATGLFARMNDKFCEITGYDRERLYRMSPADLTHPDDRPGDAEKMAALFRGETQVYQTEKRYVRPDGRVVWVNVSATLTRDDAGRPFRSVGVIQDVTARRNAEDALKRATEELEQRVADRTRELAAANAELAAEVRERMRVEREVRRSEQRYRSLVENTTAIVWGTPASGEFETPQPGWSEFTGQTFEQLRGWGWIDAVHPDDRQNTARVWSAAVANKAQYDVEHRLRRRDGAYRHMHVRAVPILTEGGHIHEWVGVHTDIDAQRETEAALLRAKESAEAASRAKGEFLANMSHEIRTPMNGVIGMTDLLLETDLAPDQRDSLRLVKSSAEALMTVINDILDFSKIEAGKLDLDPIPFSLREAIGSTLKAFAVQCHQKGLELACDVAGDVPEGVVGDAGRLRQVLNNLVGNAVKFTEKGEIVVRVSTVPDPDGVRLRFDVTDTGIGIPAKAQKAIFDAFTQADGSTTRKFGGTGLGLTISARLVALMGGRIWVESESGKGSRFSFEVRFDSGRPSAEQILMPPVELRGMTVLVVDDNATNRRVLEDTLRLWGADPSCVDGGGAAVAELHRAAAAGSPYRLVLLDAMMPEMDGFAVAEAMAREPGLAGSTVMMLTSADRSGDAARCKSLGLAAYLVKPIQPADLRTVITNALSQKDAAANLAVRKTPVCVPPPAARDVPERPLKVLLAEDNPVNQMVVVRILEGLGHSITVANHGGEAVEAFDRERFDVILMDVQMPHTDGFAATRLIRERESGTGRRQPIVAMTAHAMKGDRERCLAAGMDDYLSKPVQRADLLRVLNETAANRDKCGPAKPPEPAEAPAAPTDAPAYNRQEALERLAGDEELFAEVADLFRAEAPGMIQELRKALAGGDAAGVRRAAHGLKGSAGYVGGTAAAEAAFVLEQLGAAGDLSAAPPAMAALEREIDRLTAALSSEAKAVAPAP